MDTISKNKYAQQAKRKALMGTDASAAETKGNIKKTATYTGRDILFGAIGGSLAGALVGRASLLVGIAVTGAGHFFGSPSAAMFGVGMMASGGYQTVTSAMSGVEKDGMDGIKERFTNLKENIKRQLFLDKIIPAKKTTATTSSTSSASKPTNGVGEVQYFDHSEEVNGKKELDFSETNHLQQQIEESGKKFAQVNGTEDDFSGTEEEEDVNGTEDDTEDRII